MAFFDKALALEKRVYFLVPFSKGGAGYAFER